MKTLMKVAFARPLATFIFAAMASLGLPSCSEHSATRNAAASGGQTGAGAGGSAPRAGASSSAGSPNDLTLQLPDGTETPPASACQGLECQVQTCAGASKTTISGKVYDPAGKMPLYNVLVYVPNAPVEPFKAGATCDRCDARILNPVTAALTNEAGSFVLADAPVGTDIPLVIQVGKWRRQLVIPKVGACTDTPLLDPSMMRLPRNQAEGDMPHIAISVGSADQLECLPLRLGIDAAEFTPAKGNGRIHLFVGHTDYNPAPVLALDAAHGGAPFSQSDELWATSDALMKYDMVLLSCEGTLFGERKLPSYRQAMYDYASQGGRVFASHLHRVWFAEGPAPLPSTGTWTFDQSVLDQNPGIINQSFPKGAALAQWLVNVGASATLGELQLGGLRHDVEAVNPLVSRAWITMQARATNRPVSTPVTSVQYMSFNTPIGAPEEKMCGREVFTNLHVSAFEDEASAEYFRKGFPSSCPERELSPQEKALAFLLFDLSSCVQSDAIAPLPPVKPPR